MTYTSVSQSGQIAHFGDDFEWQGGEKNKGGNKGSKQYKMGEIAQPQIDHWINFSSLILWLVSFMES